MHSIRRAATFLAVLAGLVLGTLTFVPAQAATPCGGTYAPCPPPVVSPPQVGPAGSTPPYVPPNVKRGVKIYVTVKGYAERASIKVRVKGHHRNKVVKKTRTDPAGDKTFAFKVPKKFPKGKYTIRVRVGTYVYPFKVKVS